MCNVSFLYLMPLQAISKCPSTKIVVSGYSQGAQLVHTATQRLTAAAAAKVSAGKSQFLRLLVHTKLSSCDIR